MVKMEVGTEVKMAVGTEVKTAVGTEDKTADGTVDRTPLIAELTLEMVITTGKDSLKLERTVMLAKTGTVRTTLSL